MSGRLAGKRIVVTAAGQGIGQAITLHCAREGASVLATDIDEALLAALSDHPGIETARLDVTDPAQISAVLEGCVIDGLANCAGYVANGSLLDCTERDWAFSFELNVTSMFRIIKTVMPEMIGRGGGSIVNISSVASSLVGAANRFAYGATKASVIGMTKSVAVDFVEHGIRCNAICPGTIQSPSLDERIAAFDDPVAAREAFVARQPMKRLGTSDEVAALALYLLSDESAFTTGGVHVIDGGWTMA